MDTFTFVTEIVKAVSWPIAALVIALVFRGELRSLMKRVRKGKIGPAEFEFEAVIAKLKERVGTKQIQPTSPDKTKSVVDLAGVDPRAVILNEWMKIQAIVNAIVEQHATSEDRRDQGSVSLRVLHRLLREKTEYIDMYNDLRMLRNQAVNEVGFSPRTSSVIEYADLVNELAGVLSPYAEE